MANPIITTWIVSLMTALAPADKAAAAYQTPGWVETTQERADRYESIASDLYAVIYDPATKPLYGGSKARARTAALLIALAFEESGFAPDVDKGPCYRGAHGGKLHGRCDGGQSACMLQVKIGTGTTPEGWTQADLFGDRRKCFTTALRAARRSLVACSRAGNSPEHYLNAYASGTCTAGGAASEKRIATTKRILSRATVPADDGNLVPVIVAAEPSKVITLLGQ